MRSAALTRVGGAELITAVEQATEMDVVFDAGLLNGAALASVCDHGTYLGVFPSPLTSRAATLPRTSPAPSSRRRSRWCGMPRTPWSA